MVFPSNAKSPADSFGLWSVRPFFDTCTVYPMARLRVCVQQVQVELSVPNHKAAKYRRLLKRATCGEDLQARAIRFRAQLTYQEDFVEEGKSGSPSPVVRRIQANPKSRQNLQCSLSGPFGHSQKAHRGGHQCSEAPA